MRIDENTKLLVVAPHPDDETLGCGGLIQKVTKIGGEVHVALVASFQKKGFIQWDNKEKSYREYDFNARQKELNDALTMLTCGKYKLHCLDDICMEDNERAFTAFFDKLPLNRYISFIERVVKENCINCLAVPTTSYFKDHNIIREAADSVCRPHFYSGTMIEYSVGNETGFVPNLFVKLSKDEFDKKARAFACHSSQLNNSIHVQSVDNVMDKMKIYGRAVYTEYAEAFFVKRIVF